MSSQKRKRVDSPVPNYTLQVLLGDEEEQHGVPKENSETVFDAQVDENHSNSFPSNFDTNRPRGSQRKGCCSNFYIFELFEIYDKNFLFALGLQYLNTGMKAMTTLAFLDLFRSQYKLEPTETQSLTAMMTLSWTPKLFYGIISDTFPICGTRKKSYIIVMGLLQFVTAWMIAMINFKHPIMVCVLGFFMNLASAFMDVVVDGLMVMQARRDSINGS